MSALIHLLLAAVCLVGLAALYSTASTTFTLLQMSTTANFSCFCHKCGKPFKSTNPIAITCVPCEATKANPIDMNWFWDAVAGKKPTK